MQVRRSIDNSVQLGSCHSAQQLVVSSLSFCTVSEPQVSEVPQV